MANTKKKFISAYLYGDLYQQYLDARQKNDTKQIKEILERLLSAVVVEMDGEEFKSAITFTMLMDYATCLANRGEMEHATILIKEMRITLNLINSGKKDNNANGMPSKTTLPIMWTTLSMFCKKFYKRADLSETFWSELSKYAIELKPGMIINVNVGDIYFGENPSVSQKSSETQPFIIWEVTSSAIYAMPITWKKENTEEGKDTQNDSVIGSISDKIYKVPIEPDVIHSIQNVVIRDDEFERKIDEVYRRLVGGNNKDNPHRAHFISEETKKRRAKKGYIIIINTHRYYVVDIDEKNENYILLPLNSNGNINIPYRIRIPFVHSGITAIFKSRKKLSKKIEEQVTGKEVPDYICTFYIRQSVKYLIIGEEDDKYIALNIEKYLDDAKEKTLYIPKAEIKDIHTVSGPYSLDKCFDQLRRFINSEIRNPGIVRGLHQRDDSTVRTNVTNNN